MIQLAAVRRKVIQGDRSERGAGTQAGMMSLLRTLKQRGYNPIPTLVAAPREYVRTGHLPPFPPVFISEE